MGEVKGFLLHDRKEFDKLSVPERLKNYHEFIQMMPDQRLKEQSARCMDCGVPFCHSGCPIGNLIPDWNDLVYRNRWQDAYARLMKTNNFPEFTGRVCPAPCENSCCLGYNFPAVTIKNIELSIIEKAYEQGWAKPVLPFKRTGKKIAVIGSGPAGLACADQLNQFGHKVVVYEKNEQVGGLLRFGIPDFKLEKFVIERRAARMRQEGIEFRTGVRVGMDIPAGEIRQKYDAMVLCGGAEWPRDLLVPGRELKGVYQAMEFLPQQNRVNSGERISPDERITAKGKNVVVIGGGDTGSDCVGTANRQGAASVVQIELMPKPPKERAFDNPWPQWAFVERKSSSHEEGVTQEFCVMTKELIGDGSGNLKRLKTVRLEFGAKDPVTGRRPMKEIFGSEFEIECDMILLALGFLGPVKQGLITELDLALDDRGNIKTDNQFMSSIPGVFAAGDMRRGQSLVVWAIYEGRTVAASVDQWLKRI